MDNIKKEEMLKEIKGFRMPLYSEIPDVGLYLEQVSKYITDCFAVLSDSCMTGSMISNYVKKKLIENPVKKQYRREQIAYLLFIAVAKSALSIEEIRYLIELKKDGHDVETAYGYFCREFENTLTDVFEEGIDTNTDITEDAGIIDDPDTETEKKIMRSILIIYCRKVYLSKMIGIYRGNENK